VSPRPEMQVWNLEEWIGPHFAVNMPAVLKDMGKLVDQKQIEIARVVEKMAPPDYPFVRLNIEDVAAALKRMTVEENLCWFTRNWSKPARHIASSHRSRCFEFFEA
jgi:hypothetical protein